MKKSNLSIVLIKNGYCCGHGLIVYRLEQALLSLEIPYKKVAVSGKSTATYNDATIELKPTLSINDVFESLGIRNSH